MQGLLGALAKRAMSKALTSPLYLPAQHVCLDGVHPAGHFAQFCKAAPDFRGDCMHVGLYKFAFLMTTFAVLSEERLWRCCFSTCTDEQATSCCKVVTIGRSLRFCILSCCNKAQTSRDDQAFGTVFVHVLRLYTLDPSLLQR